MAIRVNTLGKSSIINRQLNSAYDIVEYVADNLPFLLDLCKRLQSIKLAQEASTFINHIENKCIHLSKEQIDAINQIETVVSIIESNGIDITSLSDKLSSLVSQLNEHINSDMHITKEERDKWNSIVIPELASVAITGSYNDLLDKPEIVIPDIHIDSELSDTSTNPVENKVITNELDSYVKTDSISNVGFSGSYNDLINKPKGDTELSIESDNWVTNRVITEAINSISTNNSSTIEYIDNKIKELEKNKIDTLSNVANSGDYNDLINTPSIPSKVSELVNDSNYISGVSWEEIENKPQVYTPDTHTHVMSDITDLDIPTKTSDLDNDCDYTTTSYVDTKVANLVNSAPETLDTLNELASALGNDPNFATTVATQIGTKANSSDVYTKSETDTLLASKADSSAVYTKTEVDNLISGGATVDLSNYYTKSEVDNMLNGLSVMPITYEEIEEICVL